MEANKNMFNYNPDTNAIGIAHADFTKLLSEYRIQLDSPTDAYIDSESSVLNKAAVLTVNCVDANPNGEFDANWFFSRDLEDALEKQEGVYSAELDKADLILKIVFNFGNETTAIQFNYANGGSLPVDAATKMVDEILAVRPENIYEIGGMPKVADNAPPEEVEKMKADAREKAIEHYRKHIIGEPVYVFFEGRKFNVANGSASDPGINYLLAAIAANVYNSLPAPYKQDDAYAKTYAHQTSVIVLNNIAGIARQKSGTKPYVLTQDELNSVIQQAVNLKQP